MFENITISHTLLETRFFGLKILALQPLWRNWPQSCRIRWNDAN